MTTATTIAWACIDAERDQWALGLVAGEDVTGILATVEPRAGSWASSVSWRVAGC